MCIQPKLVQCNGNPGLLYKYFLFPAGYREGDIYNDFKVNIGEGWWEWYQLLGSELKIKKEKTINFGQFVKKPHQASRNVRPNSSIFFDNVSPKLFLIF